MCCRTRLAKRLKVVLAQLRLLAIRSHSTRPPNIVGDDLLFRLLQRLDIGRRTTFRHLIRRSASHLLTTFRSWEVLRHHQLQTDSHMEALGVDPQRLKSSKAELVGRNLEPLRRRTSKPTMKTPSAHLSPTLSRSRVLPKRLIPLSVKDLLLALPPPQPFLYGRQAFSWLSI